MKHCTYCGNYVTDHFARVFCDNDGVLRACKNCASYGQIPKTTVKRVQRAKWSRYARRQDDSSR